MNNAITEGEFLIAELGQLGLFSGPFCNQHGVQALQRSGSHGFYILVDPMIHKQAASAYGP